MWVGMALWFLLWLGVDPLALDHGRDGATPLVASGVLIGSNRNGQVVADYTGSRYFGGKNCLAMWTGLAVFLLLLL